LQIDGARDQRDGSDRPTPEGSGRRPRREESREPRSGGGGFGAGL
jgi:hypothetical protein